MAAVEVELRAGGEVETVLTEREGHAAELAGEACRTYERLYVLSGDGGFNEAVNGLDGPIAVGFLPGGGTNVLPRALGLPRDPVRSARLLARSQTVRRISLGRVNGRRFTFSAGLGLDAELIRAVDRLGRAHGPRPGDLAFVLALARILASRRGRLEPAMTVLARRRVAFALVANCDPYTYLGRLPVHVAPKARFELGLDLVAPERLRARMLPRLTWSVLAGSGGHLREAQVLYLHDADRIALECDSPMPLQADGEDVGNVAEAVVEAERDALDVIVLPSAEAGRSPGPGR